jgi:uncharacterized cupredoxin-like copper-binding protein
MFWLIDVLNTLMRINDDSVSFHHHSPHQEEIVMLKKNVLKSCLVAWVLMAIPTPPALADTSIKVSLWDKGGEMDMSKNMGMGMGMRADMKMAMMGIQIDKKTIPAGKTTFEVMNSSKEMQHEMLISPIATEDTVLPFIENENRVDEEKSGDLGEVSELEPGKSGALTLELKPGLYILFCNIPAHYMMGMWTVVKVE